MRKINESVRELRQNRNLSQNFLAEGICSREALTRFEQRGTRISAETLFQILDKMNITIEEFMFALNDGELSFKQSIFQKGISSLHNAVQHKDYLDQLDELYQSTNDKYYHLLSCLFTIDVNSLSHTSTDQSKIQYLTNYLNQVDTWGRFELALFVDGLSFFPSVYILNSYKTNISRMYEYTKNPHYQDQLLDFFNNVGMTLIKRQDLHILAELLPGYDSLTQNKAYASDRITYLILKKIVDAGATFQISMIDQELSILNYLGFESVAKSLQSFLETIYPTT
ncbi:helix-turn-helix domain-containing protein [Lapidilactobacillus bayanensis]|uniref:helix-turn-helix domain-containing protein n=1 Tax=Lapidilactobacillus bayanensis TaxID=2485998 RepID=UPI000F78489A|nr:Rgg/GadR/MutR family transcriptional regulator [Lapidilactobacillus bayanensis]